MGFRFGFAHRLAKACLQTQSNLCMFPSDLEAADEESRPSNVTAKQPRPDSSSKFIDNPEAGPEFGMRVDLGTDVVCRPQGI